MDAILEFTALVHWANKKTKNKKAQCIISMLDISGTTNQREIVGRNRKLNYPRGSKLGLSTRSDLELTLPPRRIILRLPSAFSAEGG